MAFRFGIVGTGMIAEFHARAIAALPDDITVVACQDVSGERATAFAERWACTPYEDLADFLAGGGMDAVIICTPSGLHREPGLAALDAGYHLVVEKPLEITADRCDTLIESAARKGLTLSGIFPARFGDGATMVKEAGVAGRFGRITMASSSVKWHRTQQYYDQAGWRGTWDIDGGGALMNQSIHAIDLLQWLAGDVVEVSAFTDTLAHTGIEVEDVAVASLRFADGGLGTIMGTTASWPGWAKRVEISGTDGSVVLEDEVVRKWDFVRSESGDEAVREAAAPKPETASGAGDPSAIDFEGHRRQLENFVNAVRSGGNLLIDGVEARKAVAIIEAVYRSARTGQIERVG